MTATNIEWADRVWNPVTGCTKVSQGCKHCYAEVMAKRTFGRLYPPVYIGPGCDEPADEWRPRRFTDVQTHADRLDAPLRWWKPARIFVNSMSDLFHEDVPDAFIDQVFAVMALAPQHTFLVLTKRPERMRAYFASMTLGNSIASEPSAYRRVLAQMDQPLWLPAGRSFPRVPAAWPLANVWLGVSVEDQATADARIPLLLQTPAAVRWISAEPLLGPIDCERGEWLNDDAVTHDHLIGLDWVVVGGESGQKARDCDVAWIRSIVGQCRAAGVPVFVKQLGANPVIAEAVLDEWGTGVQFTGSRDVPNRGDVILCDRKGSNPDEWPSDLRVREFPAEASDWLRSDGGQSSRTVADRWKRMVLGLLRREGAA